MTPEYIGSKVRQNFQKLQTFAGKARVIIEFPGNGYNGFAEVYMKMPDSVMVKTEAILGIDIGLLFMNSRFFAAFAPRENTLYYGEIETLDLRDFLEVELKTNELYEVFSGLIQISVDSTSTFSFEKNQYVITTKLSDGFQKDWVDPGKYVVTKSILFNQDGEEILVKEFLRVRESKGIVLPQTIRVTRPQARERITVYYTRQEINDKISAKKFVLNIPRNARRVYWGELDRPRMDRERLKKTN